MIGGFSLYELCLTFYIYGFAGWCTEVIYAAVKRGRFVNRGFLNGPICPVYGVGVALVLLALTPININFFVLFLASAALTTALEFVTGFVLEKVFHRKWWDYSGENFNIRGYVCLRMSLLWGLACVLVIDVIHPAVFGLLLRLPVTAGYIALSVLTLLFVTDLVFTVLQLMKLNKRFRLIDTLNKNLSFSSDKLGEGLYKATAAVEQKLNEFPSRKGIPPPDRKEGNSGGIARRRRRPARHKNARGRRRQTGRNAISAPDLWSRQQTIDNAVFAIQNTPRKLLRTFGVFPAYLLLQKYVCRLKSYRYRT